MIKKIGVAILLIAFLSVAGARAATLRLGFAYGPRTVSEEKINTIYSHGTSGNLFPSLELKIWKGLTLGAGYEFGYRRTGVIGPTQDATTLTIRSLIAYLGYEVRWPKFGVFVQAGGGRNAYKQTIDNPDLSAFKVDHAKASLFAAAGVNIYPLKFLFLTAKLAYIPLKVQPFDVEVDLSGFRFQGGLGFSLDF